MDHLVRITTALADPGRVRLLAACFGGERCVCQLVALLGLSNAAVSKHLSLLRDAGLLASRKQGRWVYYRLPEEPGPAAGEAIAWVRRHAEADGVIRSDREQLDRILAVDPAVVCRLLREGGEMSEKLKECCG
jgi:DNA-binding transcriptional ArsR family regulator